MKRITVAGHSLHPMLVVFPLGLLITSLIWDIAFLASDPGSSWGIVSFWTIVAGVIGGLAAAVPGFLDWLAIPPNTRAKRVGATHGLLNLAVVILFSVGIVLRIGGDGYALPALGDMLPGWIALALGLPAAWLGGELVERLGIGVSNFQDVNAPSSLREPRGGERLEPIRSSGTGAPPAVRAP